MRYTLGKDEAACIVVIDMHAGVNEEFMYTMVHVYIVVVHRHRQQGRYLSATCSWSIR